MLRNIYNKGNRIFSILTSLVSFALFIYVIIYFFGPPIIDKKFNTSSQKPPYQVSEEARALYDTLPFIADLHCDALLWGRNLEDKHDYGHVDIPRMIEANLSLQSFTIVSKVPKSVISPAPDGDSFKENKDDNDVITGIYIVQGKPFHSLQERALDQCEQLNNYQYYTDEETGKPVFRVIKSADDLQNYISARKVDKTITAGFLGIEGMQVLEGNIENVDTMYNAGVRMMAPVHFFDNKLGGSAHGMSKAGLTDFGREVIKYMEIKRMIVDLAHASPKMIDDVLEMSTRPVIVSHTGVKGTCNNVRNLSDNHLKKIAAKGGLVGIAFFAPAVCGNDAKAIAKAIKYAVDLIGVEHVALGSDFDGAIGMPFDVTGLPLLVEAMLDLGLSAEDISKIMGTNTRDFLLKNLPPL